MKNNLESTNLIFDLHGVIFCYNDNGEIITLKPGLELLKLCASQKDSNGKKLHKIYIFSNWGIAGFKTIKQNYPQIINLFDDILISGNSNYQKPQPEFYQEAIDKFNLSKEKCVFIDDVKANIETAEKFGWIGLHYNNPSHIELILKKLNII